MFALARGMGFLILAMLILQGLFGNTGVWLSFLAAEFSGFLWMRHTLKKPDPAVPLLLLSAPPVTTEAGQSDETTPPKKLRLSPVRETASDTVSKS